MRKNVVLSIAGSDPSGGAGIQADLKSFSYLGLHGATVVTCVTAQNTQKVTHIHKVPVDIIEQQLDRIFEDFTVTCVKTGMLYDAEIVACVTRKLQQEKIRPVVDPVMVATSGDNLAQTDFADTLKKHLLPISCLLTANIPEAEKLTHTKIRSIEDMRTACTTLEHLGPDMVLIKGGHLQSHNATDVFFDGTTTYEYSLPMIHNTKAHGSGCTLSALITGLLAMNKQPADAVRHAKWITWNMINQGYHPGKGSDVLNHHLQPMHTQPPVTNEEITVWITLKKALDDLLLLISVDLIPEVGINFVYALPHAQHHHEVCGLSGRIIKRNTTPWCCGEVCFGGSKHVAAVVLAASAYDPSVRSALNIKYSPQFIDTCRTHGFTVGCFDRKEEPADASSTMEWGTRLVVQQLGQVPDIIYDKGAVGKEPMIRILGKDPSDVLLKLQKIITK
ncbi:MAG: bifunctional hydroxymethylpyrimidine kinase/phosphomethylpyrimidine kinase [Candidatus Thermoplasmatota archaeon]